MELSEKDKKKISNTNNKKLTKKVKQFHKEDVVLINVDFVCY